MRLAIALLVAGSLALGVADDARADDAVPAPPPPPRWGASSPVTASIPVPDVRGLTEGQAASALARAGLRLGGTERVSIADLEQQLGQRYGAGIVVQQAPPPSAGDNASWLPRGSQVWLRVTEGAPAPRPVAPPTPVAPLTPVVPVTPIVPDRPLPRRPTPSVTVPSPAPVPYTGYGGVPQRPPPPTWPPSGTTPRVWPVEPAPLPLPSAPQPYVPQPVVPRAGPTPPPLERDLIGPLATRFRLPCERGREAWHVRVLGGWAFAFGDDDPESGPYAGAELGYTFDGCVGLDAFYRFASQRYSRRLATGTFNDAGDTHHAGLKLTFESSLSRDSRVFFFVGLGGSWFKTRRLDQDDDGFGFFGEGGLGYLIDDGVRARLGVNAHALSTRAGRGDPAADGSDRWLWTVAPTLGLEIDL